MQATGYVFPEDGPVAVALPDKKQVQFVWVDSDTLSMDREGICCVKGSI